MKKDVVVTRLRLLARRLEKKVRDIHRKPQPTSEDIAMGLGLREGAEQVRDLLFKIQNNKL